MLRTGSQCGNQLPAYDSCIPCWQGCAKASLQRRDLSHLMSDSSREGPGVKIVLCEHEDPHSIPAFHRKNWVLGHALVISVLGGGDRRIPGVPPDI